MCRSDAHAPTQWLRLTFSVRHERKSDAVWKRPLPYKSKYRIWHDVFHILWLWSYSKRFGQSIHSCTPNTQNKSINTTERNFHFIRIIIPIIIFKMVVSCILALNNHHQLAPPSPTYFDNCYDCHQNQHHQQGQPLRPQPLKPNSSQANMPHPVDFRQSSLLSQHTPTSAFHMIDVHSAEKRPLTPPSPVLSSFPAPLEKKRKLKHKKSVRFADDSFNQVHTRYYDTLDLQNAWMQQSDYQAIRIDNRNTLLEIKRVKGHMSQINNKQFCIRGLEEQISVILFRGERSLQRRVVRSIMFELNAQRYLGIHDPLPIASLYSMMAKPFVQRALYLARRQQGAAHA